MDDLRERVAALLGDGLGGVQPYYGLADDILAIEVEPGVSLAEVVAAYRALGVLVTGSLYRVGQKTWIYAATKRTISGHGASPAAAILGALAATEVPDDGA